MHHAPAKWREGESVQRGSKDAMEGGQLVINSRQKDWFRRGLKFLGVLDDHEDWGL